LNKKRPNSLMAVRLQVAITALYAAAATPTPAGHCTRCEKKKPIILRASMKGRPFQLCAQCEDHFHELAQGTNCFERDPKHTLNESGVVH
jgi:hypothetical protein